MANIYFATNRLADATVPGGFGDSITIDPAQVQFGVIEVTGTDLAHANSGQLGAITHRQAGGFDAATRAEIIGAGKNLLVFIHGFANSFADAMKRAAFNRAWFAAGGRPEADTTVLAFTWPSSGEVFGDDKLHPTGRYREDRIKAGQSDAAIAAFLRHVLEIAQDMKQRFADSRVFLLAHSMGNHALNGAVERFFDGAAPPVPFDEAILAAADEVDRALELADQSGMYKLRDLATRISIYASGRDVALKLSFALNGAVPLGLDGAESEENQIIYPAQKFRSVDCTLVFDLLGEDRSAGVDVSHQYYRRSRRVRNDLALLMANGEVRPGMSRLFAPPLIG